MTGIDRDAPVSRSMSAMLAAIPGVLTLHEAERASRAVLDAILPEVQAQTLEEFAELQDNLARAHGSDMDDDDLDEHRRFTAALRNGAAEYRKAASE